MADNLVAEIISVGTELLLGEIVDTNATFLSTRLRDLGIAVYSALKHTVELIFHFYYE